MKTEVDDQPVSIFILNGRRYATKTAETYLRNRGWDVQVRVDLREAFAEIIEQKPRYLLIAADHPSPGIRQLPRLINQSVITQIIVFADANMHLVAPFAQEIRCQYQLSPPISGPGVERMIRKIEMDAARPRDSGRSISVNRVDGRERDGDAILFSGDSSASGATSIGGARGALHQATSGITLQDDRQFGIEGADNGGGANAKDGKPHEHDHESHRGGSRKISTAPVFDQTPIAVAPKPPDSVLARGANEALLSSVGNDEGAAATELDRVSRVGCIDVNTGRFSGYLLVAWAGDGPLSGALLAKVRGRLVGFLREQGESIAASNALSLRIKDVPFETWALEQAEFLRKSVHEGKEIAVAFFPGRAPEPVLEASAAPEMASISIEDLEGDAVLEFDLYVRLESNNKYILYTPTGGKFYQAQKDRLIKSGVARLHLHKAATDGVQRYQLQNHFNKKIEEK